MQVRYYYYWEFRNSMKSWARAATGQTRMISFEVSQLNWLMVEVFYTILSNTQDSKRGLCFLSKS